MPSIRDILCGPNVLTIFNSFVYANSRSRYPLSFVTELQNIPEVDPQFVCVSLAIFALISP